MRTGITIFAIVFIIHVSATTICEAKFDKETKVDPEPHFRAPIEDTNHQSLAHHRTPEYKSDSRYNFAEKRNFGMSEKRQQLFGKFGWK